MSEICYRDRAFAAQTTEIIEHAQDIITEYAAQNYALTLRQLYYQFVARDLLANTQANYKRLGSIITDARLAGLISWTAIEDRTRSLSELSTWSSAQSIVRSCVASFRMDLWRTQPHYVEVWVEKEALAGVIESVCSRDDIRVPYFSCRGYVSASAMWEAAQRIMRRAAYRPAVILHLGDHDPSGIDMTRDIAARIDEFADHHQHPQPITIDRIALNRDQIDEYNPPPNPAKLTDSRASDYIKKHGRSSWELDALEPAVLADLISSRVLSLQDQNAWEDAEDLEQHHRERLEEAAELM